MAFGGDLAGVRRAGRGGGAEAMSAGRMYPSLDPWDTALTTDVRAWGTFCMMELATSNPKALSSPLESPPPLDTSVLMSIVAYFTLFGLNPAYPLSSG